MDLHPDLIDLLTELESFAVEYLIVGGWAVGIHGEPRFTKDLDLLVGGSPENIDRLVAAIARYGAPPELLDQIRTMAPDEFVFFGVPPARIDLLRQIPGVAFDLAWPRRREVEWHGVKVHVIGLEDLLDAKRAAGRQKDLDDVRLLERARASKRG